MIVCNGAAFVSVARQVAATPSSRAAETAGEAEGDGDQPTRAGGGGVRRWTGRPIGSRGPRGGLSTVRCGLGTNTELVHSLAALGKIRSLLPFGEAAIAALGPPGSWDSVGAYGNEVQCGIRHCSKT